MDELEDALFVIAVTVIVVVLHQVIEVVVDRRGPLGGDSKRKLSIHDSGFFGAYARHKAWLLRRALSDCCHRSHSSDVSDSIDLQALGFAPPLVGACIILGALAPIVLADLPKFVAVPAGVAFLPAVPAPYAGLALATPMG